MPADKFIGIAENSGLIVPIGEWVLRTACRQARQWQDEGLPAVTVAVNVSAVQFRQAGFCELIRRVLNETGLAPQNLELELTESLLLANADVTLSVIQELKAMGLTLAIDDFGTGYSSFNYLRQFGVGKLKIDRSFIRDIAVNLDDAAITAAIISMLTKFKATISASLWRLTKLPTNCAATIPNTSEHKQAGDNRDRGRCKECISLWPSPLRFWRPLILSQFSSSATL